MTKRKLSSGDRSPRLLSRSDGALYVGLSRGSFDAEVRAGTPRAL